MTSKPDTTSLDPVLVKRARIKRLVGFGLRGGYGLYCLSAVLLAVGLLWQFNQVISSAIMFCLIVGSLMLAPAMVFKYAVKAADRADRDNSW